MKIWAIGDLHLSFGVPNKSMDFFGAAWKEHPIRVAEEWDRTITEEDLVLIPGDISWAMTLQTALPDLEWIDKRPGTKVLIKGNHDYWWNSISKARAIAPKSIHLIQNDIFIWKDQIAVGGARLWDSDEYQFHDWIEYVEREKTSEKSSIVEQKEKITSEEKALFQRELLRLEESLKKMPKSLYKIAMTHYPPIGPTGEESAASSLFEKYGVSQVIFGHLHSLKSELKKSPLFGIHRNIRYTLTSCDWIECRPICIYNKD